MKHLGMISGLLAKAAISACEKASQWQMALEMFASMPEQESFGHPKVVWDILMWFLFNSSHAVAFVLVCLGHAVNLWRIWWHTMRQPVLVPRRSNGHRRVSTKPHGSFGFAVALALICRGRPTKFNTCQHST